MVPHLDFELVIAGNYFTDKQKRTGINFNQISRNYRPKNFLRVSSLEKVEFQALR